ncbi:hypothetical protein BUE80_DR002827 [Diplocarpon rosae]|nr:hypothetical protein BUE80_DR002827 [Diplocarpon rosae]
MSSLATPFEEEREVGFQKFYSMTLGEVINERYKVVAKLGSGSASTIWCGRNLATNKYAALKIYTYDLVAEAEIDNETTIYKHRSAANPDHPGKMYVRTIQDSFFVVSRAGNRHRCLVHEVLSNDILNLQYTRRDRKLPEAMHIKEENILLGLVDPSIVEQLDTKEIATSSLYKSVNGYHLYRSTWDMFENRRLFDGLDPETGKYRNRFHLASIVGLLGPPPLEFVQRSKFSSVYFDDRGNWKCVNPVRPVSWEDSEMNLEASNKEGFLNSVRKMVRWTPESRASPPGL